MTKAPAPSARASGRSREAAAILAAAHAVLEKRAFADTAKAVLSACETIVGAEAGFVALRAPGGSGIDVVHLDPGRPRARPRPPQIALTERTALLRDLSERAVEAGRTLLANDLSNDTARVPPVGQGAVPASALVAPILISGEVAGLLGLLDKPGGFSAADAQLAELFAEMAAVAMLNSRTVNGLEKRRNALEQELRAGAVQLQEAEQQFRTLVENLPDIIARFDPEFRHLYVSPAVTGLTGRPPSDFVGKTNQELGSPAAVSEPWEAALRRTFATGRPQDLEFAYPGVEGTRHFDCRLIPEMGPGGAITSVLTVARDVTDRWLAFEAERNARAVADSLREATVVLTRSLDRESVLVTLLDRLRRMVPFDRGRVMLVEGASRLSLRAVFDGDRALPLPAEARPELDALDHPIVRDILTTGAAVLVPDVRARPDWSLPKERPPEASWMGVPLFARGSVTGFFSLSNQEAGYFKEEHVKLAEALSSQASVAVENAVLFEQMQASSARLKALSRRLVEAQESERRHIALELHDEAGQALVSLAPRTPTAGAGERRRRQRRRTGGGAGRDDRRRHRRPAPPGRRSAPGQPRPPRARRRAAPVRAVGHRQVRHPGPLQGARVHQPAPAAGRGDRALPCRSGGDDQRRAPLQRHPCRPDGGAP